MSLTLHVARNGDTGSLNLTTGNPLCLEGLDSEGSESKLIATLGYAFTATFLGAAEFGFLRL